MKKIVYIILLSTFSATLGAILTAKYLSRTFENQIISLDSSPPPQSQKNSEIQIANSHSNFLPEGTEDFVLASNKSTSSVVFIQTTSEYEYRTGSWLDWFFDAQSSQQTSAGSGVILSEDGYIITNNHVVENANKIKVISGRNSYEAKLVGRDPSTDLAVVKVEVSGLSKIELGDSDEVNVGEWVLAVGNPFNLTSTVTAGIISAKGRNLNLLRDQFPIESFIQTDAAINPGNSGGALVNARGELIGINTAILSRTGSYAGYGFAVPVNIVKKVFNDIVEYGEVQKAFIGAEYVDIDENLKDRLDLSDLGGVVIAEINNNGAAFNAGLKKGDVIRQINGLEVENSATIEEIIGNKYPGDKIQLVVSREGREVSKNLTLTNREGGTGIIRRNIISSKRLGARLEEISQVEKSLYDIKGGVQIVDYEHRGLFAQLEIPKGFIITQINNVPIESPEELEDILIRIKGRVRIYGVDQRGRKVYYSFWF